MHIMTAVIVSIVIIFAILYKLPDLFSTSESSTLIEMDPRITAESLRRVSGSAVRSYRTASKGQLLVNERGDAASCRVRARIEMQTTKQL